MRSASGMDQCICQKGGFALKVSSAPSFSDSCFYALSFNMDDMGRNSFQMHATLEISGLEKFKKLSVIYVKCPASAFGK